MNTTDLDMQRLRSWTGLKILSVSGDRLAALLDRIDALEAENRLLESRCMAAYDRGYSDAAADTDARWIAELCGDECGP